MSDPHPIPPATPPPEDSTPDSPVLSADDAGSRALDEALRSSFFFVKVLMVVLLLAFLGSGFFTVKPNQVAVILRFGKPQGEAGQQLLQPGFHWALPYPVDEVVTLPITETHVVTSSIGWYASTTPPELETASQEPPASPTLRPGVDGYTLTSDGNIIHVWASLKYRIANPWQYAFRFADVTNLIQNVLNDALNYASASYTAEGALYKESTFFRDQVRARVNKAIEENQLGITLETLEVRSKPPLWVKSAFVEVQGAEQDRSKKINDAEGYAREVILRAEGEARDRINTGSTWSNQLVQAVMADQKAFTDQLPSYLRDPGLFKQRLLLDKLRTILPKDQDKFVFMQPAQGQSQELRLQLNREPLSSTNRSAGPP